jgi:hypothetical protein
VESRFEYKYLLNRHEAFLFYQQLKAFSVVDEYCNEEGFYYVTSVYFDDYFNQSLTEKIDGLMHHRKIRLRHYNDGTSYKIEVKDKSGDLVRKNTVNIGLGEANEILSNPDKIKHYLDEYYSFTKLEQSHTVKYKRYVLKYPKTNVRITFDYEVACKKESESLFVHVLNQDQVVVEVKYNDVLPDMIESLMGNLGMRQSVSKYSAARLMY